MWSYAGTRDPEDPRVARLGIASHVTADYPPTFISVGNADPLAPQSIAFAEALRAKGVEVDSLFFPPDHKPPLDTNISCCCRPKPDSAHWVAIQNFSQPTPRQPLPQPHTNERT
ncbi:alpha/beta hydrolase [Sphingopyxis sp.]|jgi:hypothetical protein|uniref:alpha/beta hydrolase n=1 Tax=Sphingomonadales TaxID=204457 RepID=UPI003F71FB9D